jgi:signal transduction histidine kinase
MVCEAGMTQRVLCIDGDGARRARVRKLLEAGGFAVDECATGLTGIERARILPPDLVLATLHLPDMDGYELAIRVKQERPSATVVAVGSSPDERDLALAAGCDGFLQHPIERPALADEVRAFVQGKREQLAPEGELRQLRTYAALLATRLEQALSDAKRSSAELAELDRLKRSFMHNLSHEISTPLTPLAGYLKILGSGKLGPLSSQQQRVFESMNTSVHRLTRIVDNLSDFANLQIGAAPILNAPVDPDALADTVVADLRAPIREARLHVSVVHSAVGAIQADPRKLRQALANLVSNAIKFSPHGGEVLVELRRDGAQLRFSVYDQGPGVNSGDAQGIFEPFYHAARQDEARQPGSGLGLPVARRIAEAHGGQVWVESPPRTQPGSGGRHYSGSKFVLEIPIRVGEGDASSPERVSG